MTDKNTSETQGDVDEESRLSAEAKEIGMGMVEAKEMTWSESVSQSLSGWRNLSGMTLNAAMAIDAVFILIGVVWFTQTTTPLAFVGLLIAAPGVFGVIEKVWRRR